MKSERTQKLLLTLLALPLLMLSAGCDSNNSDGGMLGAEPNIVETAISAGDFETLVAAVEAAGLKDTLSGEGPFTVFAPTDEAFDALPEGTLASLLEPANKSSLENILLYHVVAGEKLAADVVSVSSLATLLGQDLTINVNGDDVSVNQAMIVVTDIMASNGIIHVIDAVLLPE